MLILAEGSIFDHYHQAYAHGVSNKGTFGKGIATEFKALLELYPKKLTDVFLPHLLLFLLILFVLKC